jgi:putative ATP-binding cassette transporter
MTPILRKPRIASPIEESPSPLLQFFARFVRLAGPFWNSEDKIVVRGLTLGLVMLTVLQIVIAVAITEWTAGLFDALEQHSMTRLMTQTGMLLLIFAANMGVTALHMRVKRRIQLDWRAWLTERLVGQWMNEGRHFAVTYMPGNHDNPDGRIAEDIRITTEYAIDLSHSLFYCLLLLISFTEILWTLSGTISLTLGQAEIAIPGHLVWVALIYSVAASSLGWWIGLPLVKATDIRQTVEANFRSGLVGAKERSRTIALTRNETDERRRLIDLFHGIVRAWQRQTRALTRILLFTSGYSVISTAFPILVSAPRYILGSITLGALMQSAQAFQHMVAALSWPVDNLAKGAEWRASVERVLGLVQALRGLEDDVTRIDFHRILVEKTDQPALTLHKVCVANPNGDIIVSGLDAAIRPGEWMQISGDPATGAKIFKVIAGLWPWGCGRVELPRDAQMFFMPPQPSLPMGPLREAVCYPSPPNAFDTTAIENALRDAGLEEFTGRLEDTSAWEKVLSREAQQRLGVARLLLHRPDWILFQEALDALAPEEEERIMRLIQKEMPDAAVLTITNRPTVEALYHRHVVLLRSTTDLALVKETQRLQKTDQQLREEVSLTHRIVGMLRKRRQRT